MLTIFHTPHTRSVRPIWALEEMGMNYETVKIDLERGDGQEADHLLRHPHGAVPVLEEQGTRIYESGAICTYLAERYGQRPFVPPSEDPGRALYHQWMYYSVATLDPPMETLLFHTFLLPEAQRIPQIVALAEARIAGIADNLDRVLSQSPFLLGDQFTMADVMIGATMMWRKNLFQRFDNLAAYVDRLNQRPACQRAHAS